MVGIKAHGECTKCGQPMNDFDYAIVDADSAGCILANRLSADGSASVCLIVRSRADVRLERAFLRACAAARRSVRPRVQPLAHCLAEDGSSYRSTAWIEQRIGGVTAYEGYHGSSMLPSTLAVAYQLAGKAEARRNRARPVA
jgi:choline dehydrogenase-like flavoprotein